VSQLWVSIMTWIASLSPGRLDSLPGLWSGSTADWDVEANGHETEIDGMPPLHIRLTHKKYLWLGIIGPASGVLGGGANEDDVIAHFNAETRGD